MIAAQKMPWQFESGRVVVDQIRSGITPICAQRVLGCRITRPDGYLVETNLMGLLDFTTLVKSN